MAAILKPLPLPYAYLIASDVAQGLTHREAAVVELIDKRSRQPYDSR